jgi:hypothetical protein
MSVNDLIATLEDLIGKMKYVADGQMVLAEHTNLFVDYCDNAVSLLKQLYELFKSKTGKTLPNVEVWISMADYRVGLMRKVKFGDIVISRDHNLVIDVLKPIELALREIEGNL